MRSEGSHPHRCRMHGNSNVDLGIASLALHHDSRLAFVKIFVQAMNGLFHRHLERYSGNLSGGK